MMHKLLPRNPNFHSTIHCHSFCLELTHHTVECLERQAAHEAMVGATRPAVDETLIAHNRDHRFKLQEGCVFCYPLPIALEQVRREARPTYGRDE